MQSMTRFRKPFVIINPAAGSVRDIDNVREQLGRLGPVEFRRTSEGEGAEKLARKAARAGHTYVIAAGGDGTVNAVVNGIAAAGATGETIIGILPLGTGNDFARSLGLAATIAENIDILAGGEPMPVDLVRTKARGTRYFVNVSAGGFSGVVGEKLTPEIKRSWGPLAYLRGAAAALPQLQAYCTEVVCDDEQFALDLYNVIVANGRFVGGGLNIAPEADLQDGLLDLMLIPKLTPAEIALLAAELIMGKQPDMITFRRAKNISVKSKPGMWFNLDGELIGNRPISFQVLPRALNFVAPKR